ncbi:MAG: T9SS type A sorting domain-containing protein [Prevotella sp.]|nr:T9SS type A sorting domain-containing protein [Prevotella sp.]
MRVFIFLLMCMSFLVCKGQDGIQMPFNMFRSGDILLKKQISYKNLSQDGEHVLWDISDADVINKSYKVRFSDVAGSKNRVACTERATMYYYDLQHDTLFIGGFENNTTKIDYDTKEIFLRFPMKYGDSYSGVFHGTGTYCDKIAVRSFGRYKTESDAYGSIILPEGDTVHNVTRIHTVRFVSGIRYPADSLNTISSMPLSADSIEGYIDNGMFMMKTDIYRWYAIGYRYPVLEMHITSFQGCRGEPYVTAFYYPPSEQNSSDDYEIYEGAKANIHPSLLEQKTRHGKLVYDININGQERVNIEYRLSAPSEISYGVYTADGKTVYYNERRRMNAGIYNVDIDLSLCKDGVYIFRIDADRDSYTEKITLKR